MAAVAPANVGVRPVARAVYHEGMAMRLVAIGEAHRRVGESHHRARLSDLLVDLIRELHDTGLIGYARLGRVFGVHKATIQGIVSCRYRAQIPVDYRRAAA
jgi:hypothetical protein